MLRAALNVFGERLLAEITNRDGDIDGFQLALDACLKQLPTKQVKAKATKGPSKKALATAEKRSALIDELNELGGTIDIEASISEIKKAISSSKKEIKEAEKEAKKAAATKLKEEKKVIAAANKAAKKASPNKKEHTDRVLLDVNKVPIMGENGSKIRISIHKESRQVLKKNEDNWTSEAHTRYDELFPTGYEVKVAKKKVESKKPKMTMAAKKAAKKAAKEAAKKAVEDAKKPSKDDKLAAEQKAIIAELVGQAVEETLTESADTADTTDTVVDTVVDTVDEAEEKVVEEDEELEEEELEELSEEEEEEVEEDPEFPGEDEIEEFEHDALTIYDGIDFYVDDNANVWDEEMCFVGKYDEESSALVIKEGYEAPTSEFSA